MFKFLKGSNDDCVESRQGSEVKAEKRVGRSLK